MRIESIRVGAHVYPVDRDPVSLRDEHDWATHSPRSRRIAVETMERPGSAIAEDLIHEVLHALFLDSGQDELDRDAEEVVCTILAPRLTAFLAHNPSVVRELLAMLGCDE